MSLTIDQAITQYQDNAHLWFGDVAKARLVYQALCTILARRPNQSASATTSLNYHDLSEERKEVYAFLKSASRATGGSFSRGRTI